MAYRIVSGAQAKQGSPEWLAYRASGLGASDAPAVMGRSRWTTPYGLFRRKTGLDPEQKMNPAMMRGIKLEPKARAAYEKLTGNLMVPMVLESASHPFLRASLDGMSLDFLTALEIKCPGAEAHSFAVNGLVPDYYIDQVQQQLFVSGADHLHYYSFDGESGALVTVYPDPVRIQAIIDESIRFWEKVQTKTWESDEWATAAAHWRAANMALEEAADREENARKALISLLGAAEAKREGAGVMVSRVKRRGTVDMDKLLASKGVSITDADKAAFRKPDSETFQVREAASAEELDVSVLQMPPKPAAQSVDAPAVDENFVLVI